MKLLTCLVALLFLAGPAAAQKDDLEQNKQPPADGGKGMTDDKSGKMPGGGTMPTAGPITGVWVVVGSNGRGQTYRGAAAVRRVGDVYRVVWKIGRSTYWGVGIRSGSTLSVAYQSGLAVYQITPNGMRGRWTTMRGTRILSENWRRR